MELEQANNRTVAIDLDLNGRRVSLKGHAIYEADPALGFVLRILVSDSAGNFELVLDQNRWSGTLIPDAETGCDFRVALANSNAS